MDEVSEVMRVPSRSNLGSPYVAARIFSRLVVFLTDACLPYFSFFLEGSPCSSRVATRQSSCGPGQ